MTTEPTPDRRRRRRRSGIGRRQLLRTGGLTVSLGAAARRLRRVAPRASRAGSATPRRRPTLPSSRSTTACYLRTATSIEYTILDVYGTITDSGALQRGDPGARSTGSIADHQAAADATGRADRRRPAASRTSAPTPGTWTGSCRRSSTTSTATRSQDIAPSDEPEPRHARRRQRHGVDGGGDVPAAWSRRWPTPELRSEMMAIGALAARHAAVVAIHVDRRRRTATSTRCCSARSRAGRGRPAAALRHPDPVRHARRRSLLVDRRGQLGRHPVLDRPSRRRPTTRTSTRA